MHLSLIDYRWEVRKGFGYLEEVRPLDGQQGLPWLTGLIGLLGWLVCLLLLLLVVRRLICLLLLIVTLLVATL